VIRLLGLLSARSLRSPEIPRCTRTVLGQASVKPPAVQYSHRPTTGWTRVLGIRTIRCVRDLPQGADHPQPIEQLTADADWQPCRAPVANRGAAPTVANHITGSAPCSAAARYANRSGIDRLSERCGKRKLGGSTRKMHATLTVSINPAIRSSQRDGGMDDRSVTFEARFVLWVLSSTVAGSRADVARASRSGLSCFSLGSRGSPSAGCRYR
jgi:hypothetical protein